MNNKIGEWAWLERKLWRDYNRNCLRRGIIFDLDFAIFQRLIHGQCYLCGKVPTQVYHQANRTARLYYNGLDRVDNSVGYTASNVQPCCKKCNSVKSDWNLQELQVHLKRMLRGMKWRDNKNL